jgi:transcriptional regulator with XRE-family HTH domain
MNIGSKLKELRIENNLSQAELGKILNTTGACISSWDRGRTEPNIGQVHAIADYFDIPATSLLGDITQNVELTANEMKKFNLPF